MYEITNEIGIIKNCKFINVPKLNNKIIEGTIG